MRFLIIFIICWAAPQFVFAQQWAGPDTATCGQLGVRIGSDDPCVDCCYLWSPARGLDFTDVKNPMAKPGAETVYTVVVTDKNLVNKGSDEVTVRIGFGDMQFSRNHLIQNDPEWMVRAKLLKHEGISVETDITWDILEPKLNCMLMEDGIDAILTPGDMYGKIIVEASKNGVPGCYVRKSIDVNNGVKDVMAVDPIHTDRIAKTGETLHIIKHNANDDDVPVIIHAVPNPGGFKDGIPNWKQDTHESITPQDGQNYFQISEEVGTLQSVESDYIAGDDPDLMPMVTVIRYPVQATTEQTVTLPIATLTDKLSRIFKFKSYDTNDGPACASWLPFTLSVTTPILKYETTTVEKYNDPALDLKEEFSLEMGIAASGRIYHPFFTKSIDLKIFPITICSRLYAELTAGTSFSIKMIKDPSLQDGTWKPESAENEVSVSIGVGGGLFLGVEPPGFNFLISGTISHSYKVSMYLEGFDLKAKGTMDPLTLKVEAKIQEEGDMGKYEDILGGLANLSGTVKLFDKKESDPITLKQFSN